MSDNIYTELPTNINTLEKESNDLKNMIQSLVIKNGLIL